MLIHRSATGKHLVSVAAGTKADVDLAYEAAHKAFQESWGLSVPGSDRGVLLNKLADLIEKNADEIAALEAVNSGDALVALRIISSC